MAYNSRNTDWFQKVAEGLVTGYSLYRKFGENPDLDTGTIPEDIWDGGGMYTFSSSADITQIASSASGDTQDIYIEGLDSNWDFVSQTITLTGQTVATLTTPLIRVFRMINFGVTDIAGIVYLATSTAVFSAGVPTVSTTIRAEILGDNNQSLMCIYSVPAGKTAYFWGGKVSVSKEAVSTSTVSWRARLFGGVFQVKDRIIVASHGSSHFLQNYVFPDAIPEKTDIVIRCDSVSDNNTGITGGFSLILKDNV